MSRSLNKVMLIGFVARAPEMRHTPAGKPVTTFSLAVPRAWETPEGDVRTATEGFNIVAWRSLAEACHAAVGKGAHVYVEGALQTRTWRDAEGHRHDRTEIVAAEVILLSGASGRDASPAMAEDDSPVSDPT